ncbi:hypothetical protein [Haloarcula sediminis]|uniref:hypothetical protein n=1 Tax=Haloarcula sediminis TaxID=3111777 RepID=UPI002D770614|nr:hypothetical protein [Haloarcula sp. CK38]
MELASNDIEEVVLIAPDGTAFDSQRVQTGVRTVRFQIIEFTPGRNTSSHYSPGTYEIVVVANDTEYRQELSLVPDLRLTDVRQYREGDSPADLARIIFKMENVGTGPTWIYDAVFQDSPNYTANGDLNVLPSIPYLQSPTTADELIIVENETQSYIDSAKPLAVPEAERDCEQQSQPFHMQIGVADGSVIETNLSRTCEGDRIPLPFVDRVVYSRTKIEWEQQEGDT